MLQTAWLLPPTRLLTLSFDPARFQTEPPACYRASWQLPGRDSHPLATASLCWITIYISTSNPGHTAGFELTPTAPFDEQRLSVAGMSGAVPLGDGDAGVVEPRSVSRGRAGQQTTVEKTPSLGGCDEPTNVLSAPWRKQKSESARESLVHRTEADL